MNFHSADHWTPKSGGDADPTKDFVGACAHDPLLARAVSLCFSAARAGRGGFIMDLEELRRDYFATM